VALRHLMAQIFEAREAAAEWLRTPIPAFRRRLSIAMIGRGRVNDVVSLLATMESGGSFERPRGAPGAR